MVFFREYCTTPWFFSCSGSSSSSSSSSSRIYYFDREGPTDVAVLLQGTLSALYTNYSGSSGATYCAGTLVSPDLCVFLFEFSQPIFEGDGG